MNDDQLLKLMDEVDEMLSRLYEIRRSLTQLILPGVWYGREATLAENRAGVRAAMATISGPDDVHLAFHEERDRKWDGERT